MKAAAYHRTVTILFCFLFVWPCTVSASSRPTVINYAPGDTIVNDSTGLGYLSMSECAGIIKEQALPRGSHARYAILLDRTVETGRTKFFVFDLTGFTIVKYGFAEELHSTAAIDSRHHIPVFSVVNNNNGLVISRVAWEGEKQTAIFALR